MDDDLISAHGEVPKLMPYLHLPVQSGSNTILKHMNRKHDVTFYRLIIDKLRKAREDMAFSSDFIVGYPEKLMLISQKHCGWYQILSLHKLTHLSIAHDLVLRFG